MENDPIPTTRPCDACGTPAYYEPVIFAGPNGPEDLAALIQFACPACTAAREEAEHEAARASIRKRREDTWQRIVPKKYRETSLDHPYFQQTLWNQLRHLPLRQSLGLIGPAGRCKTRMLALTAKRAIAADFTVGWCPANSFQWAAAREFDKKDAHEARQWLKEWRHADILIFDDLGKHRWTDCVESAFFGMLEHRASNGKTTHWSMNPDPADVAALPTLLSQDSAGVLTRSLDPEGKASARPRFAPIVSRLLDEQTIVPVL
jgi:hypothetical protein